ncbi:probable 3',5'-cyclic phosphodiesterase pde-5 isoform X2 [Culicoides brevitarsis]|uniref:probable 3',5'-cyclic phosphodiesterase pde-5 isoform X2 n=1 Tax=Culicoides brevitarsis TaxID=469753 RepID=UPI00307C1755
MAEISSDSVGKYLKHHPEFLEHFLIENVGLEELQKWVIRRLGSRKELESNENKNIDKMTPYCVYSDKRQMLEELSQSIRLHSKGKHVLWELIACISTAVGADGFRLYLNDNSPDDLQLSLYVGEKVGKTIIEKVDRKQALIPYHVAETRQPVRISKGDTDPRFPDGLPAKGEMAHLMCQAVQHPDGKLVGVVEFWRRSCTWKFFEQEEELVYSYLVWGGVALHYADCFTTMEKQKKLNDFLLVVVRSMFQDMVSMDTLMTKIMNFAQRLVNADRASLFLVDTKKQEVYATLFDVGADNAMQDKSQEIRFPIGKGIAGYVAETGEVVNVVNAYQDPRFNNSIDKLTGYKTESILCMPIFIKDVVIGVVQMVNKLTGSFTTEDEEAFETFAVYCGLALHHAKLFDKIKKSEHKYKVALEVLSYHNSCTEDEVNRCMEMDIQKAVDDIDNFFFCPYVLSDFEKAAHTVYMFIDLFGLERFDKTTIIRFTLTVKKNYRRVPYHNWGHGFSVANTMYTIIKKAPDIFRQNERLALFVGCLCHDLDHRGKTNKFLLDTESPLSAIYSTSTMEHHHFNQTVTILQQEGHNIFSKLSSTEYKQLLSLVKHCILATDLALFFPNKSKLEELVDTQTFSWSKLEHRLLISAVSMTSADLSASAKPWEIQEKTVKVIFEEFYIQGDAEKEAGRKPIPMMDRTRADYQASCQVDFIKGICIPCYKLLNRLIPETEPMLLKCEENLKTWETIMECYKKLEQSVPILKDYVKQKKINL